MVIIGVDPHKRTHTASALEPGTHRVLATLQIDATLGGYRQLARWAARFEGRRWAVENARGLGRHLAQWLAARGERIDDVPCTATARVRELSRGGRRKNDVIDAAAAASVAALAGDATPILVEDLSTVLALLDERRANLAAHRTRLVNQLHALLRDLIPGGADTNLTATQAARILTAVRPVGPVEAARKQLARDLVAEVREVDARPDGTPRTWTLTLGGAHAAGLGTETVVDEDLEVEVVDDGPEGAVAALSGPLSLHTVPQITGGLGKILVDRGCVLVDLTRLWLEWEPAVTVFASVLAYAGGWPGARMVLFGADGALAAALDRSRVSRSVPLAADLQAAMQRVQRRPERVRRHRDLPAEPAAARAARALIRQACLDWEVLIGIENAAALVVSELATNAVMHAGTPLRACAELDATALSVSVRDLRPDLPLRLFNRGSKHHAAGPNAASRPLGLHVVSVLASNWGVTEQPDAKTVWAQLPLPAAAAQSAEPSGQDRPGPGQC